MFINLRDFYPYYTCDAFVEVSDEIGAVLLESKREEKNYIDRLGYHKAYYSLDRGDGIENDAVRESLQSRRARFYRSTKFRCSLILSLRESCWGVPSPNPAYAAFAAYPCRCHAANERRL